MIVVMVNSSHGVCERFFMGLTPFKKDHTLIKKR